jgi:hypothetical protein
MAGTDTSLLATMCHPASHSTATAALPVEKCFPTRVPQKIAGGSMTIRGIKT